MFGPDSVSVARYASIIGTKSPTKWDAQPTESNFQTRFRACRKAIFKHALGSVGKQFSNTLWGLSESRKKGGTYPAAKDCRKYKKESASADSCFFPC
nr:DUF6783 domain-containing protein [Lachnoclostridium pacaense]